MDQNKKVTTLYLVRHGTTAWNQALRYQGQTDNPLDEIGERQGACLEEYFKDIHVDLGVTSPLQRAVKTGDRFRPHRRLDQRGDSSGVSRVLQNVCA